MLLYLATLAAEASGMLGQAPCSVVVAIVLSSAFSAEPSLKEVAQLKLYTREINFAVLDPQNQQSVLRSLCHWGRPHGDGKSNSGLVPASLGCFRTVPM